MYTLLIICKHTTLQITVSLLLTIFLVFPLGTIRHILQPFNNVGQCPFEGFNAQKMPFSPKHSPCPFHFLGETLYSWSVYYYKLNSCVMMKKSMINHLYLKFSFYHPNLSKSHVDIVKCVSHSTISLNILYLNIKKQSNKYVFQSINPEKILPAVMLIRILIGMTRVIATSIFNFVTSHQIDLKFYRQLLDGQTLH